jgi:hypothetical protein
MGQRRNGLFGMLTSPHSLPHTHTHIHSHTASRFDVPEEERQLLPSGFFGMLSIHIKANVGLAQRLWGAANKTVLKTYFDPDFRLGEFLDGAKFAYKIIRLVVNIIQYYYLSCFALLLSFI